MRMTEPSLKGPLSSTPSSPALQQAIINGIFRIALARSSIQDLEPYFTDWFEEKCQEAAEEASVQTYGEVIDIVSLLQHDLSRAEIVAKLYPQCCDQDRLNVSIDLAARLWLTISIGTLRQSLAPGNNVVWNDGSLSETLNTLWPEPQLLEPVKLPKAFNALNLERIAGTKFVWTSNLADHLRLREDDTMVLLYHQVSFLELHATCDRSAFPLIRVTAVVNFRSSILPAGLIDETKRTLALLIPSSDRKSRGWFQKKQMELRLDNKAGTYGPLNAAERQIENFRFWRDRLVILKQAFDESEPHTLSLWWNDDRKKVQWYTFWVAALVLLLTIVFGLTQAVSGIVQAWASVRSMPG